MFIILNIHHDSPVVFGTNAIIQPFAMMVKVCHTFVTLSTVFTRWLTAMKQTTGAVEQT